MKKIRYILVALIAVAALSECTSEVDDKFDQPSAQRIETALSQTKQILEGANNGWIMYYYGNTSYGGYNVYCKFDKGMVTVQSEIFDTQSATSGYKVEQSGGVTLSFDEYNRIFHFFSDPSVQGYSGTISDYYAYLLEEDVLGDDGEAFEGDLEFRVLSASADSVVMTGKKHGDHIVMYPAGDGFSWADYLDEVRKADESIFWSANYRLNLAGETLAATQSSLYRTMTVTDAEGNSHAMPYIVIPGGLKLYQPQTFSGQTIEQFNVDEGLTFTETSGSGVTLTKYAPPLYDQLTGNVWQVRYSQAGEYGQAQWDRTYTREQNRGYRVRYLYFGTYAYSSSFGENFGLHVGTRRSSNGTTYWGTIAMTPTRVADDEITLEYYADGNVGNGDYFYSTLRYYYLVSAFAGRPETSVESRTFKLTSDNPYKPSYITLTDENDPTNVITVSTSYTSYPYGK